MFGLYLDFCSLGTFMLPNIVFLLIATRRRKLKGRRKYIIWGTIFSLYCYLAIVQVAGIGTIWDILSHRSLDISINLRPFSSEGALTYVLNIIMFVPLGFLLPLIWQNFRMAGKVAFTGFLMSMIIEVLQLFSFRTTDIDDLLMNTVGTIAGFLLWMCLAKILLGSKKQNKGTEGNDAITLILLGSFSTFFLYYGGILY